MKLRRRLSPDACGAPVLYRIDTAQAGGYVILVAHFCPTDPPCRQYTIWGPFAELEDAVSVRRMSWPNALPGEPGLFPVRAIRTD